MSGKPQRKGPKVANPSGDDQYGVYDDPHVSLDQVTTLQTELDHLSERCAEEILQVEQKYNALRKPFLEQRTEMIRNIPEFWLSVLLNHPQLSEIITEEDEGALQALQSIEVEDDEDMKSGLRIRFGSNRDFRLRCFQLLLGKSVWYIEKGSPVKGDPFSISIKCPDEELSSSDCISQCSQILMDFPTTDGWRDLQKFFSENDYFENPVLTKEYLVDPNTNEPISQGVQINWKPGKNLTQKERVQTAGTKRAHEETDSFFLWFNDRQIASEDPVAEIIKEDLWPNPLSYFLNTEHSINEDEEDGEEGEGDFEEYDEEEDQAIIEEDEEDEEP